LFPEQKVSSLVDAISGFEDGRIWRKLSPEALRLWAENFSTESFSFRFQKVLIAAFSEHRRSCAVAASDPSELFELSS